MSSICLPFLPLPLHRPTPQKYKHLLKEKDPYTLLRSRWILNPATNLESDLTTYQIYTLSALNECYVKHDYQRAKLALQQALAADFKAKFESEYLLVSAQILAHGRRDVEAALMFDNIIKSSEKNWQVKLYAIIGLARVGLKKGNQVNRLK